jgi:hypothetical protein
MDIPLHSVDLIKGLRKAYPKKHPHKGMTERDIWWAAGASSVVDGLEASLRMQEENIMEQKITTNR